jgi:hypothetical protein
LDKPLDEFYRATGMRDGYRGDCKACNAAASRVRYQADPAAEIARVKRWQQANADRVNSYHRQRRSDPDVKRAERSSYLQRKYGLTIEQYDAMLAEQGGGCAICTRPPSESISLHVDHDHETGRIRGLLCFRCNNSLGDLEDSPQLLLAALNYVDGPTEEERRLTLARLAGRTPAWA